MNIWITGLNLSIDTVVKLESKDKYERVHAKQWKSVGSKGANVFRSLIRLGTCPHIIALTWGHTGTFINNLLHSICNNPLHIHTLHHTDGESRINIITLTEEDETLISAESPSANKELFVKHINRISHLIEKEDILVITGSFPANLTFSDLQPLIAKFLPENIWIDLKGQYLIDAYHTVPDAVFKVNHVESHDLTSRGILPSKLIVTSATRTIAYISGEHIVVNIPTMKPLNTVGAGDVFMASLIYEKVIKEKSWSDALRFSAARATQSTQTLGVSEWNEEKIEEILKLITIYHSS